MYKMSQATITGHNQQISQYSDGLVSFQMTRMDKSHLKELTHAENGQTKII